MRRTLERAPDSVSHLPNRTDRAPQARCSSACDFGLRQAGASEALDRPIPDRALGRATPSAAPDGDAATAVESGPARKEGQPHEVGDHQRRGDRARRGRLLRLWILQRVASQTQRGRQTSQRPPHQTPMPWRRNRRPRPKSCLWFPPSGRSTWAKPRRPAEK